MCVLFLAPTAFAQEQGDETPGGAEDQAGKAPANIDSRERWLNAADKTLDKRERAQAQAQAAKPQRTVWFMDDELLARAGIGEEQAVEIRQVIADTEAEMKALRLETGSATGASMGEMVKLLTSDEFSVEQANELLDRILQQRNVLVRMQLEPKIRVRAVLTASQVAALRAERPRFFLEPLVIPPKATAEAAESAEGAGAESTDKTKDETTD